MSALFIQNGKSVCLYFGVLVHIHLPLEVLTLLELSLFCIIHFARPLFEELLFMLAAYRGLRNTFIYIPWNTL